MPFPRNWIFPGKKWVITYMRTTKSLYHSQLAKGSDLVRLISHWPFCTGLKHIGNPKIPEGFSFHVTASLIVFIQQIFTKVLVEPCKPTYVLHPKFRRFFHFFAKLFFLSPPNLFILNKVQGVKDTDLWLRISILRRSEYAYKES